MNVSCPQLIAGGTNFVPVCSDEEEADWNTKLQDEQATPRFIVRYSWYTDTLREDPELFRKTGTYDLLFLRYKNENGDPIPNHMLTDQITQMVDAIQTAVEKGEISGGELPICSVSIFLPR